MPYAYRDTIPAGELQIGDLFEHQFVSDCEAFIGTVTAVFPQGTDIYDQPNPYVDLVVDVSELGGRIACTNLKRSAPVTRVRQIKESEMVPASADEVADWFAALAQEQAERDIHR